MEFVINDLMFEELNFRMVVANHKKQGWNYNRASTESSVKRNFFFQGSFVNEKVTTFNKYIAYIFCCFIPKKKMYL